MSSELWDDWLTAISAELPAATELRHRLRHGRPVDGLVPPAVVRAIRAHGLYTDSG